MQIVSSNDYFISISDEQYGCHTNHPLLKLLKLRDILLTSKQSWEETISEMCLSFEQILQTCLMECDKKLLDCF